MLYYVLILLLFILGGRVFFQLLPYAFWGFVFLFIVYPLLKKRFPSLFDRYRSPLSDSDEERPRYNSGRYSQGNFSHVDNLAEIQFLTAMSCMMAKMAKASGHIAQAEINSAETVFRRLGLSSEQRKFCIDRFHDALKSGTTIYEYAATFSREQPDPNIREILYGILWDIAVADGVLQDVELEILRHLTIDLQIRHTLFTWQYMRHTLNGHQRTQGGAHRYNGRPNDWDSGNQNSSRSDRTSNRAQDSIDAYAILDCSSNASNDEVKKAFRKKAKENHPDVLVLKGVPREKANEQMARINAAWDQIRKERSL